jgi:hypothetical protein
MKVQHCCLCGGNWVGRYGNNPAPLAELPKVCCDECNRTKVIPARFEWVKEEEGDE